MKPISIAGLLTLSLLVAAMQCGDSREMSADLMSAHEARGQGLSVATFAGGCFWCTEADFEKVPGVKEAVSGYAGGDEANPTYEQVSRGRTRHLEAVQVYYDSTRISYPELLEYYWRMFDPTDDGGSFVDRGYQYTSAIFYGNVAEKRQAEASKADLAASGRFDKSIVTPIRSLDTFYPAEDYHQDYYKKNPAHYNRYRSGSGRDQFIQRVWGDAARIKPASQSGTGKGYRKPSDEKLREMLTPLQYRVTQEDGTEPAFNNRYWDNKREGIYVDIVSGEPLFSSTDKYRSGTGWPSFVRPLEPDNIVEKADYKLGMRRTEVRSRHADSHLGHVFEDGPPPTGLRYCMNSAALRFVPRDSLEAEGYGRYTHLFD